jgi:hypothetical protein
MDQRWSFVIFEPKKPSHQCLSENVRNRTIVTSTDGKQLASPDIADDSHFTSDKNDQAMTTADNSKHTASIPALTAGGVEFIETNATAIVTIPASSLKTMRPPS